MDKPQSKVSVVCEVIQLLSKPDSKVSGLEEYIVNLWFAYLDKVEIQLLRGKLCYPLFQMFQILDNSIFMTSP